MSERRNYMELPMVTMVLKRKDLQLYYSDASSGLIDYRDLVVAVRSKFPNPWQRVLVEADFPLASSELERSLIFTKSTAEEVLNNFLQGIDNNCYQVIQLTNEMSTLPGCGIQEAVTTFSAEYDISLFDVLIVSDNNDLLRLAWDFTQNSVLGQRFSYPLKFTATLKLFTNGLDISVYAKKLDTRKRQNNLDSIFLRSVFDEVCAEVDAGKTAIQDLEDTRSFPAKWLTMAVTQIKDLPPVYLDSYIAEYVNMRIAYPLEKLSFTERFSFVNNIGKSVGYIGTNLDFRAIFAVVKRIYPNPAVAFNMATGEIFTEELDKFSLARVRPQDYRGFFPNSKSTFITRSSLSGSETSLVKAEAADEAVDQKLAGIFYAMTKKANLPDLYMSIRNTAPVIVDGQRYIVYYPEPFGLGGFLVSEIFGQQPWVIDEFSFHRLIDTKVVLAIQHRESQASRVDGQKVFNAIMVKAARDLIPAIDPFVYMCSVLCGHLAKDLSYYDQRLRCDTNILPIITHTDAKEHESKSIVDYLSLQNIRDDPLSQNAISAFGTLNASAGSAFKLQVSIKSFKGCVLLDE